MDKTILAIDDFFEGMSLSAGSLDEIRTKVHNKVKEIFLYSRSEE